MLERQKKLVVAFRTTTGAMAMERLCREQKVSGRLIPLPRTVSAGCGMCWAAPLEQTACIEELVIRERLDVDGFYELLL